MKHNVFLLEKQIMEILYNGAMNTICTISGVSNESESNNSIWGKFQGNHT